MLQIFTFGTLFDDFPNAVRVPNIKLDEVANEVLENSENLLELLSKEAKLDCFFKKF